MNKKKIFAWILAATMFAAAALTGCASEGANEPVAEATADGTAKEESADDEVTRSVAQDVSDDSEADFDEDDMVSLAEITDEEESSEAESDDLTDSFTKNVAGCYEYKSDDPLENRVFEFRNTDGRLYFEYESECDYAGAELEIIKGSPVRGSDDMEYQVMMYPFSSFSFGGDYWGKGFECSIRTGDNSELEITGADLLLGDKDITIKKTFSNFIHDAEATEYHNTFADEVLGSWRCTMDIDGEKYDVYLELTESGQFALASKTQDYPVAYYIGSYNADWYDEGLLGDILCERFACGDMPYEWKLIYDTERKCPVVVEEYNEDEPGKYNEDEFLPFKKSSPGAGPDIKPGPGSRGDDLQRMFDSYGGDSGVEYEDEEEGHQITQSEIDTLQEAVTIFPIGFEYEKNYNITMVAPDVVTNWRVHSPGYSEYAGLKFEKGKGKTPIPLDYPETEVGGTIEYMRTDTKIVERALQGFYNTNSQVRRTEGYDFVVDDDYVTVWGPGYIVSYEGYTDEWYNFSHYMDGDVFCLLANRTVIDDSREADYQYKLYFEYNPKSLYNYSLVDFDIVSEKDLSGN